MIETTRLRFIGAPSKEELERAINELPFKIELKGAPVLEKSGWVAWFVLPEKGSVKFQSFDLRG